MAETRPPALSKSSMASASLVNLVPDYTENVIRLEAIAASEEGQLNDESARNDAGANFLDELATGFHGATGGQKVIYQEDAVAGLDGVDVDVQFGPAVFEIVECRMGLIGQLARLT